MKTSRARRKSLIWFIGILALGAGIGAAGLYATQWSLDATSTTSFCVSCHSMDVPHQEWQNTPHFANAEGIQAGCADCHIPHEGVAYLKKKMTSGISDVIAEITGGIPDAETYEARRAEMAKEVWAEMEANDSRTCRSCHDTDHWDLYEQSTKAAEKHRSMAESGDTCISCHRGIAHFPPDLSEEADAAANELSQLADETPADADQLYPVEPHGLFAVQGDSTPVARIMPSAPLEVTDREGDWRRVRLDGFQPPEVERVIYRRPGKRIVMAAIEETESPLLTRSAGDNDPGWQRARLSGWVRADAMVASAAPIWDYGRELNNAYCGSCHSIKEAGSYTANQWPSMVNAYTGRTSITEADKTLLTFYLQTHANDMPEQEEQQ